VPASRLDRNFSKHFRHAPIGTRLAHWRLSLARELDPMANPTLRIGCVLLLGSSLTHCGGAVEPDDGNPRENTGGVTAHGGAGFGGWIGVAGGPMVQGGAGFGGWVGVTGGSNAGGWISGVGTGGVGTGGVPGTGGAPGTGGVPGTGGAPGTAGVPGTGGVPDIGGAVGAGAPGTIAGGGADGSGSGGTRPGSMGPGGGGAGGAGGELVSCGAGNIPEAGQGGGG
jgi:hypothetical protein